MRWTLSLFAVEANGLAFRIQNESGLIDRTIQHIQSMANVTDSDVRIFRELLTAGLTGDWPKDGTTDSLDALCWFFSLLAEDVTPTEIRDFRSVGLLEDTGLLAHFTQNDCPIRLPDCGQLPAFCGYLPSSRMHAVIAEESDKDDPPDQNCRMFRTFILDLIESLVEENLDLFLILK